MKFDKYAWEYWIYERLNEQNDTMIYTTGVLFGRGNMIADLGKQCQQGGQGRRSLSSIS